MKITLAIITFVLAVTTFAQSSKRRSSIGQSLFQEQCVGCHGSDGRAQTELGKKLGAADLTSDAVQQRNDSQLATMVKNGKGKMPTFDSKLGDDEIRDVITYIRHLAKKQ